MEKIKQRTNLTNRPIITKQEKKPNTTLEALKGFAALAGSTFFLYAAAYTPIFHEDLLKKFDRAQKDIYETKSIPSRLIFISWIKLIQALKLPFATPREQALASMHLTTALGSIASYILGKYGITKLYNTFKQYKAKA